jgi:hypothetical protein
MPPLEAVPQPFLCWVLPQYGDTLDKDVFEG